MDCQRLSLLSSWWLPKCPEVAGPRRSFSAFRPSGVRGSCSSRRHGCSPAKPHTLRSGAGETCRDPLPDYGPLELGEDPDHLEHGPTGWCGGLRALPVQNRTTPLAWSSRRSSSRSTNERPSRSTDQAATMSMSRRATASPLRQAPGMRLALGTGCAGVLENPHHGPAVVRRRPRVHAAGSSSCARRSGLADRAQPTESGQPDLGFSEHRAAHGCPAADPPNGPTMTAGAIKTKPPTEPGL